MGGWEGGGRVNSIGGFRCLVARLLDVLLLSKINHGREEASVLRCGERGVAFQSQAWKMSLF